MSTKFELQGKKLTFRYTDIDGIRKRYTCKSSLKKEAELERNEFLAQLNQSKKHNGKYNINTLLWPHFCQLYINNYVIANNIEPSVIKALIKQINDILKIKYLKELDNENINRFIAERRKTVSPATTNRQLHVIKSMWTYAINTLELNVKSPAKSIKDTPTELVKNIDFFTNEERKKILTQIEPTHLKTLCWLMFSFALRLKEAVCVKWADINFQSGKIFIYPHKTKRSDPNQTSLTMPDDFVSYIEKIPHTSEYVCGNDYTSRNAGSIISKQIRLRFKKIVGRGKAHMCRHTFVSHAINNPNIKERDIMKVARIKNPKVLDIYAHYTKEREKTIANEIYNVPLQKITVESIDKQIEKLQKMKERITKMD